MRETAAGSTVVRGVLGGEGAPACTCWRARAGRMAGRNGVEAGGGRLDERAAGGVARGSCEDAPLSSSIDESDNELDEEADESSSSAKPASSARAW